METLSLLKAIQKYLMLPHENTSDFAKAFLSLPDKDKADLREWFPQSGACNISV